MTGCYDEWHDAIWYGQNMTQKSFKAFGALTMLCHGKCKELISERPLL
jgi:hypothetical protein